MFDVSFRTLDYVIISHQALLSKTTKHWDSFVSHCIKFQLFPFVAITKVPSSLDRIRSKSITQSTLRFVIIMCYSSFKEKKIVLFFVEGAENPADLFTKNLGTTKFLKFREQLGLEFYLSKLSQLEMPEIELSSF